MSKKSEARWAIYFEIGNVYNLECDGCIADDETICLEVGQESYNVDEDQFEEIK